MAQITIQDYQKALPKKNPLDVQAQQAHQSNVQTINQQANEQSQQAYILNEKLKQYLGVVNAGRGMNGISQTGQIQVANQLSQNLGGIQQQKNADINSSYQTYVNTLMQNQQQAQQQAYQQQQITDDRAYDQSLIDQQNASQRSLQRLYTNVLPSIEREYMTILSNVTAGMAVDKNVAKQKLMDYVQSQYGAQMSEDDMIDVEMYINTLLSGEQLGSKQSSNTTDQPTDDYERDYTKRSSKYAFEVDGKTYYLDFSGAGEGYYADNFGRRAKKEDVAQAASYMLEQGRKLTEAEVSRITGVTNKTILNTIMKDLDTFISKNNINWR